MQNETIEKTRTLPKHVQVDRPILRYHGGKWKLAPWIIEHFPEHRIYTETFGGAGSILLRKPRSFSEVYNDLYSDVVTLFKVLRDLDKSGELIRRLALTPYSRVEFEESYSASECDIETARKLIVRAFMGFSSASATTPNGRGFCGGAKSPNTSPADEWARFPHNISQVAKRFIGVVIENRPAMQVLKQYDTAETLHYVDPPYPKQTRTSGDVYAFEMDENDHRELGATLNSLKGMVVLSGYACELYDNKLFPHWHRVTKDTFADHGVKRTEVLWLNPAAKERLFSSSKQVSIFEQ